MQARDFSITYAFTYQPEINGVSLFEQEMSAEIETNSSDPLGWSVMGIHINGTAWTESGRSVIAKWVELPDELGHNGSLYQAIVAFLKSDHHFEIGEELAQRRATVADVRADAYAEARAS